MLFYHTIQQHISYEIPKVKGSRFIGDIFPIKNKDEIENYLQQLHKLHPQANHWCYGYHLGINEQKNIFDERYVTPKETKYNDDGEPTNTAAGSIKNILTHYNLQNTLLVITRYFGGILLGRGGLVNAYTSAAKATIEKATLIQIPVTKQLSVSYKYKHIKSVYNFCKKHTIAIAKQDVCEAYINAKLNVNVEIFDKTKKELEALGCIVYDG